MGSYFMEISPIGVIQLYFPIIASLKDPIFAVKRKKDEIKTKKTPNG